MVVRDSQINPSENLFAGQFATVFCEERWGNLPHSVGVAIAQITFHYKSFLFSASRPERQRTHRKMLFLRLFSQKNVFNINKLFGRYLKKKFNLCGATCFYDLKSTAEVSIRHH